MSAADTARVYYAAMREELNQDLQIIHQTLFLYLGAITAIFGTAMVKDELKGFLMIIPFLSMSASIIVDHHERHLGAIAAYCAKELEEFLRGEKEDAPQWDNSVPLDMYQKHMLITRLLGDSLIIILPAIIALWINREFAFDPANALGWWLGTTAIALSLTILIFTRRYRQYISDWSHSRNRK